LIGENGLLKQLTKAVIERALQAEMTVHLGHEKHGVITSKACGRLKIFLMTEVLQGLAGGAV
jgi:transposase-like protein